MARNSKAQKIVNSSNQKPKGLVSDSNAKKTRSMDEILGINAMEFHMEEKTEKAEILEVQQSMQSHISFSKWLSAINNSTDKVKRTDVADMSCRQIDPISILKMSDNEVESDPSDNGDNVDNVRNMKSLVKIELEDVQSEVDF